VIGTWFFSFENRTSRRRVSPVTFNVKAILGVRFCFGVIQLPEAGQLKTAVASEDVPLVANDWPRGDGGEFVLPIWFVECSKRYVQTS
jgi:hypothetical protein